MYMMPSSASQGRVVVERAKLQGARNFTDGAAKRRLKVSVLRCCALSTATTGASIARARCALFHHALMIYLGGLVIAVRCGARSCRRRGGEI
jgi:hypothetical protein